MGCKKQCMNCKLKEQTYSMFDAAINIKDNYQLISNMDNNKLLYEQESVSLKRFLFI